MKEVIHPELKSIAFVLEKGIVTFIPNENIIADYWKVIINDRINLPIEIQVQMIGLVNPTVLHANIALNKMQYYKNDGEHGTRYSL